MSTPSTSALTAEVSDPGGGTRGKAWRLTGLLVLLYVVNWADKAVLGIVAQPLAKELGLSASQIGLVGSAFFLTFTVGGFFAGMLDKYTTLKWSMVLLSIGWAAAMLPTVFAATFAVLLFSRMFLGFTEGPSSALIHTGTYSWHPREKRGLPSACITGASSIAKIVVAPVLALVVAQFGWRAAFLVLAVAGVAWCAIWLPSWEVGPYGEEKASRQPGGAVPDVPWRRIILTPSFLGGAAAIFAMYALVTVVLTWLPSYFEVGLGYSAVQAGSMFGFPSIASLVLMFALSFTSDRLIARGATSRVLRGLLPSAGLVICGAAMTTLPLLDTPWVAVAVVSVGYAFGASIFPLFNSAISEIVPPQQLAGTLGVFMAIMSTGGLLGPYLTGLIVDGAASAADGYALAFQIFGIIALVGGTIALLAVNPERDKARLMGARAAATNAD
ncbi:MFS transporter [Saccharopolyspora sp. NPDC049426]|uniref:MFS transporter n=1 Tax=Saccharopolyspora sp. NPDC049426 TaxID=3155652 RepID=UPI00343B124F